MKKGSEKASTSACTASGSSEGDTASLRRLPGIAVCLPWRTEYAEELIPKGLRFRAFALLILPFARKRLRDHGFRSMGAALPELLKEEQRVTSRPLRYVVKYHLG